MRIYQFLAIIVGISFSIVWAQEMPPANVVVAEVSQQEVAENRSFLGLLYYDRISHVSSEVAGLVDTIAVRQGERVNKGDILVRLNTEMLDTEIALSRTRIEQEDLRSRQAEKNYKRLDSLYAKEGVSEKDYDDAFFAYQDSIKEKQAHEKELEKLLLHKRKSVIKAPFDGVILEKSVDSGDWIQQGNKLVSIGSENDLFVRVPIGESLLRYVTIGDEVIVNIIAFNRELSGTIVDIDPRADEKTKNVFLKVQIPTLANVAENMSASVYIPTSEKRQLAMIPRDALIKFQGEDFVYTIKEDKASILPVNIVTYLGNNIGADNPYFEPGMKLIVEGNERLRPDQPVIITGEK